MRLHLAAGLVWQAVEVTAVVGDSHHVITDASQHLCIDQGVGRLELAAGAAKDDEQQPGSLTQPARSCHGRVLENHEPPFPKVGSYGIDVSKCKGRP